MSQPTSPGSGSHGRFGTLKCNLSICRKRARIALLELPNTLPPPTLVSGYTPFKAFEFGSFVGEQLVTAIYPLTGRGLVKPTSYREPHKL